MALLSAAITGLTGLAGAFINKREREKDRRSQDPAVLRKKFEDAGLDPAWAFGGGYSPTPNYAPTFGSDIANAAADATQAFTAAKQLELQRTELEQRNEALQRRVENLTMRPNYGGLYGGTNQTPAAGAADFDPFRPHDAPLITDAENVVPEQRHVVESVQTRSGEQVNLPVGPDIDEVIMGAVAEGVGYAKRTWRNIADGSRDVRQRTFDAIDAWSDTLDQSVADTLQNPTIRSAPRYDADMFRNPRSLWN